MKKLEKNDWLKLTTELTRVMIGSWLEKTSKELIFLLEGRKEKISNNFKQILSKYWVNLKEISLNWESLCKNGKNSPLKVALQIFYSSLHPKLKWKDLNLENIDLNNNPDRIVNIIIKQWIENLWIKKSFDDRQLEVIKIIWLEVLELISNHEDLKDILEDEEYIYSINSLLRRENWLESLKLISDRKDLKDILKNSSFIASSESLLGKENWLEILKLISDREDLKDILKDSNFIEDLESLVKKENWLKVLELISNREDLKYLLKDNNFIESLRSLVKKENLLKALELISNRKDLKNILETNSFIESLESLVKKENWLEILTMFAESKDLFSLVVSNIIIEKYNKIQKDFEIADDDIEF